MQAAHFVGLPEGNLALAEAAVYLALAPKSNALYTGYGAVLEDIAQTAADPRAVASAQRGNAADER